MQDQILAVVWRFLEVEDLIRLSQTNRGFHQLIKNDNTWNFLLQRDFNIKCNHKDHRKKYFKILLKRYTDLANKYSNLLYAKAINDFIPDPNNEFYTPDSLKEDAYEYRNYALSALGYNNQIDKYGTLCGNNIGEYFWDHLDFTLLKLEDEIGANLTVVDALIDNIKVTEHMLKTRQTGYRTYGQILTNILR